MAINYLKTTKHKNFRFSRRCLYIWRCSGLLHGVLFNCIPTFLGNTQPPSSELKVRDVSFWLYAKVPKKYTASIFRARDGGSMFLRKLETKLKCIRWGASWFVLYIKYHYNPCYFFYKKKFGRHSDANSVGEGDDIYTDATKKVPEHRSGVHLSEEDIPELSSGAFHHKVPMILVIKETSYWT
jgi:hypothetical protein